jgi:hypothetical protein
MRIVHGIVLAVAVCALPVLSAERGYSADALVLAQAQETAPPPAPAMEPQQTLVPAPVLGPQQPPNPPAVEPAPPPALTPGPQQPPQVPTPPPLPAPQPPQPPLLPPPLPPAPVVAFFMEQGGQAVGPLSIDQIKVEIEARRLTPKTMVWKSGDPAWMTADQQPDLKPLLGNIPPPVPPEAQWRQFLVGTWQASITSMNSGQSFTQTVTTQFRPDGTFVGVVTMSINGTPGSTQPLSGTWTIQAITGDQFTLTENAQGQPPVTVSLRRVDPNTIANDTDGYQATRIGG